jgi:hypothetical protein
MARTNFPVIKSDRTLAPDLHYALRCYWPCPCGNSVPDAPAYCTHSKPQVRAKTNCTDVLCCVSGCEYIKDCPAYKVYQVRVKLQKTIEIERRLKENK